MKRAILILIILQFVLPKESSPQSYFNEISRSVGVISYAQKDSPYNIFIGTGTLIEKRVGRHLSRIFIVTNKHVLPTKRENDFIHFKIGDIKMKDTFVDFKIRIFDGDNYSKNVKFDPQGDDLALINISTEEKLKTLSIVNERVDMMLQAENLATRDTLESLGTNMGEEVMFIGFPSFFYDKRNMSPVTRIGVIATDPKHDFYFSDVLRSEHYKKFKQKLSERWDGFLIDANVYGGSSGSLVILKPQPIQFDMNTNNSYFEPRRMQPYILGITTTSYFDVDARSAPGVRLNLGGVIPSEAIVRTINSFN